ncbi:unnamed protein product [Gadus morhua 'NCC']
MKNASARDFFQASKVAAGDGGGSQSDHCLVFSTIKAQEHLLEEQQCFFHLASDEIGRRERLHKKKTARRSSAQKWKEWLLKSQNPGHWKADPVTKQMRGRQCVVFLVKVKRARFFSSCQPDPSLGT